jgi:hypothetical protein
MDLAAHNGEDSAKPRLNDNTVPAGRVSMDSEALEEEKPETVLAVR